MIVDYIQYRVVGSDGEGPRWLTRLIQGGPK
jgi:hypothetical protein